VGVPGKVGIHGRDTDEASDLARGTGKADRPACWVKEPDNQRKSGGFPRTVWPQQSIYFTRANGEVKVRDRFNGPKGFAELKGLQHNRWFSHCRLTTPAGLEGDGGAEDIIPLMGKKYHPYRG